MSQKWSQKKGPKNSPIVQGFNGLVHVLPYALLNMGKTRDSAIYVLQLHWRHSLNKQTTYSN